MRRIALDMPGLLGAGQGVGQGRAGHPARARLSVENCAKLAGSRTPQVVVPGLLSVLRLTA